MKLLLPILFISLLLSSCSKGDDPAPNQEIELGLITNKTINIGGVNREYHLFVPQNYSNAPIVLLFHGHNSDNTKLIEMTPYKVWLDKAEAENIIVAIPNGLFTSEEEKGWNDCRSDAQTNSNADDVQFINNLIVEITNTYEGNASRVYISGSSNGGHMCIKLAQEIPEKITAFASLVSSNAVNSECSNSNIPVSALFMNGTSDPLLPYNGGQMTGNRGEVFSTENTIDYWVNRNGTNITPSISTFPDINTTDNSTVEMSIYSNGINSTEVALYKVIGGGHTEPSIVERYTPPLVPFALGNQNGDIEMVEEVWSFFENKTK